MTFPNTNPKEIGKPTNDAPAINRGAGKENDSNGYYNRPGSYIRSPLR